MVQTLIGLRGVGKTFHTGDVATDALVDIDLDVMPGEFLAIMGPSGCGKTTLMSVLALLDTPSTGDYLWKGEALSNAGAREIDAIRRDNIGVIFQSFHLIEDMSVFRNVELPLLYKKVGRAERKARVMSVLERLGVDHRARHLPSKLSGGQQQRVAIARSIVADPAVILADEPTGNLDSANSAAVMSLLKELNDGGTAVIIVTHSDSDAAHAKRIIRLSDGRMVAADSPELVDA